MNLGTAVFLVIIIYLTAYVIQYLGKEKLAIYEVSRSGISEEISGTGIILRQESLVKTDRKGYVNYYVKDGSRVKKDGIVYMLDTTGRLQSYLNELADEKNLMTDEEKGQIFEDLQSFSDSFSDDNFQEIYDAQGEIAHDLMSYTDTVLSEHREELEEKYGKESYVEVEAEESGLVSFFSDGMETLKESSLSEEDFGNMTKMEDLRSREEVRKGAPVYRLITGQEWSLIIPVSKDDYKRMKDLQEKDVPGVFMGVGGSFDVISGNIPRAPMWMQKAGLEWLFRVLQEPGRLWKRYLIGNTRFIISVYREKYRKSE